MKLNRSELKKIIYDFNSISNRLLQADFEDYNDVLPLRWAGVLHTAGAELRKITPFILRACLTHDNKSSIFH